jgi:hypothetical protein
MWFLLRCKAPHFLLLFVHLSKHLEHIVHELKTVNYIELDFEMHSQTVYLSFFDLEKPFCAWRCLFEV